MEEGVLRTKRYPEAEAEGITAPEAANPVQQA
jgi:hypothetical protein